MSIFKRLFRDKDDTNNNSVPVFKPQNATIKALGSNLQKRFSRGVQYNMKILIRGDRNVGKSALLNRLKGQDFVDQYIPTEEIEVACIHWTYKGTEDVVKVEVWDVVDKSRKRVVSGLKLENNGSLEEKQSPMCLDAEFLDVYKGAHGVIIILDMTKSWTLTYVERELAKLPEELPVLVLANHVDMGHHRTVSADQVTTLLEPLPGYKNGTIKYWEASMQNGYGLVYIHRFFSIPFLMLQRDTLRKQLVTNETEMKATLEDLEEFEESSDSTYDSFVKTLKSAKTATMATAMPPQKPQSLGVHSNPTSQINSPSTPPQSSHYKGSMTPVTDCGPRPAIHPPQARPIPGMDKLGLYPLPVPGDTLSTKVATTRTTQALNIPSGAPPHKKEIFDFVPDEQPELSSFLDDQMSPKSTEHNHTMDSSSDDEEQYQGDLDNEQHKDQTKSKRSNPMVAVFQDDIDEDDVRNMAPSPPPPPPPPLSNGHPGQQETTSSSDNEEDHKHTSVTRHSGSNGVARLASAGSNASIEPEDSVYRASTTPTEEHNQYSHITFDATDLEILEQMSSKKEEVDPDEITIHSTSSTKKKKSKKHHKHSETKESSTKKKKKKSSRRCEEEMVEESEERRGRVAEGKSGEVVCGVHTGSSDSLEKFLNE